MSDRANEDFKRRQATFRTAALECGLNHTPKEGPPMDMWVSENPADLRKSAPRQKKNNISNIERGSLA